MNYMQILKNEFQSVLTDFNNSPAMSRITRGDITIEHYKWLMRQIFHHTRENPQLQVLATVYFRGHQRDAIKNFFKHATSEIGHDQLALNDVAICGEDISQIPFENPLPNTMALLAFPFYQIYNQNPISYLGYLFFLEFAPTQSGKDYMQQLLKIGVPAEAMTFLKDHTVIDMGHNKLMEQYVNELVTNNLELDTIIYAMKVTGQLYAQMIQGAFQQVDNPREYGFSNDELTYKRG